MKRSILASAGIAALVSGYLAVTPAFAVETCESVDAVTISDGVCEVIVTESGVWESPDGVETLEVVLIGGGGSAALGFGGGAGDVVYIDDVAAGSLDITIGVGGDGDTIDGLDSELTDGDGTTTTASGGQGGNGIDLYAGGSNGHNQLSFSVWGGNYPSGQGYYAATDAAPGDGVYPSLIDGINADLWPSHDAEECYAQGGNGADASSGGIQFYGCGGGYMENLIITIPRPPVRAPSNIPSLDATENGVNGTGSGAGAAAGDNEVYYGGSGVALIHFPGAEIGQELADTGFGATSVALLATIAASAGAAIVSTRRRRA